MTMSINKDSLITTGGSQFVNFTNGVMRITVIGEDTTENQVRPEGLKFVGELSGQDTSAHKLAIYSAEVSIPDTGISIPLDTIMGRTREINDIFNTKGSYAGSTMGTEVLNTTDMTIGFSEDYVYLSDNPQGHVVSRDILTSMLKADSFKHGDSLIKVAGTNGAVKRGRDASSDRFFGGLFVADGKLIVPQAANEDGSPVLEPNSRVVAYNTTALTVMVEFLYTFSEEKKNGFRFVYTLNSGFAYNEADDVNKISCTSQILCDPRIIKDFWINGEAANSYKAETISFIAEVEAGAPEGTLATGSECDLMLNAITAGAKIDEKLPVIGYTSVNGQAAYVLCAEDIAIPALIGGNGANPNMDSVSRIEVSKLAITDFAFLIYDFDLTEAKFKPHMFK